MNITPDVRPIALLGHPVAHSLSPAMHNAAFEEAGLPFVYIACDVAEHELASAIRGLAALGFRGANVTIPHKRATLDLMDELTPQASATQAVNTIICDRTSDGVPHLVGDNTDVTGFVASLHPVIEQVMDRPALVLGSGGASRAVVYALATTLRASAVTVAARTPARAERMLQELELTGNVGIIDFDATPAAIGAHPLIINTTPVGMHPHEALTPIEDLNGIGGEHIVYDLIYRPRRTRLLRDAAERGAVVIDGLEMLIGQAAAAFVRWTGTEMPIARVREELESL